MLTTGIIPKIRGHTTNQSKKKNQDSCIFKKINNQNIEDPLQLYKFLEYFINSDRAIYPIS